MVFVSCSDSNDQPEMPLKAKNQIIESFNRFDSGFDGFLYVDLQSMKDQPVFEEARKAISFSFDEKVTDSKRDIFRLLKAVNFNLFDDAEFYSAVLYTGDIKTDFCILISGNFEVEKWKKTLPECGWVDSRLTKSGLWAVDVNKQYYIRFESGKLLMIVSNPELMVTNNESSQKVSQIIESNFDGLTLRNQGLYYLNVSKDSNKKMFRVENEKNMKIEMDKPPKEVKGLFYFDEAVKMKGIISFRDNDGLFAATQLSKLIIGFKSLKSFFNNETTITSFLDIDREDSVMTVNLNIPGKKLADLTKN